MKISFLLRKLPGRLYWFDTAGVTKKKKDGSSRQWKTDAPYRIFSHTRAFSFDPRLIYYLSARFH
jgi:hypothetical protein